MCGKRESAGALRSILDLAFRTSGNPLAARLRDLAEPVNPKLLEAPAIPRRLYDISGRLPLCFEYLVPAPERFLLWLIAHTGGECRPRPGLKIERVNAGRRADLFGGDEIARRDARTEATRNLLLHGAQDSWKQWWAFEGPTSVDCFLETPRMVLLVEGKRTEPVTSRTEWFSSRNQIARNLEAAQSVANGRNYGVLLIAEEQTHVRVSQISAALPHMSESELSFLAEHYLGCITWRQVCEAARLSIALERELVDVRSAQQWLRDRGYVD